MKKIIGLIMAVVLVISLSVAGYAQENMLTLSDGNGESGQTVYLAVQLNQPVMADAVGVSYTYDPAALEALPTSCTWSQSGTLQDFDRNNAGVWAVTEARELKDSVCVLAFRIKEGFGTETKVSCTLLIKCGGETVGEYTAEATVRKDCVHEYGDWKDQGNPAGHVQTCKLCEMTQIQSHEWEQAGQEPSGAPNMMKVLYVCKVCGGEKTQEEYVKQEETIPQHTQPPAVNPESPTETEPGRPTETNPTVPKEDFPGSVPKPTEPLPTRAPDDWEDERPTAPTNNQNVGNDISRPTEKPSTVENTVPKESATVQTESTETVTEDTVSEETEPEQGGEETQGMGALPLLTAAALLLVAGAWYLKKKYA